MRKTLYEIVMTAVSMESIVKMQSLLKISPSKMYQFLRLQ